MENIVSPTFRAIDHQRRLPTGEPSVENVTRIIEQATIIDVSGIEDKLDGLLNALVSKAPQQIYVKSADPIIKTEIVTQSAPKIHVDSPVVKVEPKNTVVVNVNPGWFFLALSLPTFVMIVDIMLRIKGK